MKSVEWQDHDFSFYDVVFHVAGIVHDKKNKNNANLYDSINNKMACDVFEKSSTAKVSQFIIMSSAAVYSQNDKNQKRININSQSFCHPTTLYGKSKMNAENNILAYKKSISSTSKIAILRPPMVYGKKAKGNYQLLSLAARTLAFFPKIDNCRSMIYIDNLCEFIRLIIENQSEGVFLPQNREYVNTSCMVETISKCIGKKIILTRFFNPLIWIAGYFFNIINKTFGSFTFDQHDFKYFDWDYCVVDFEKSILMSESKPM
jgi:UDP-glucose 4-epimerase